MKGYILVELDKNTDVIQVIASGLCPETRERMEQYMRQHPEKTLTVIELEGEEAEKLRRYLA
jgi:hypothetical protein